MGGKGETCHVISFVSQKGGQAKSTLSNALAYYLADLGSRVLLVDLDSQATQTEIFGFNPKDFWGDNIHNIVNIFRRKEFQPIRVGDFGDGFVDLAPAHSNLWYEAENTPSGKDMMLKRYIDKIKNNYDYIIVDTKGGASTLMANSLVAADTIAVPIVTSFLDEAATDDLFDIIQGTIEAYDLEKKRIILIPSRFNKQQTGSNRSLSSLKDVAPLLIKDMDIASEVRVTEAFPSRSAIAESFAHDCKFIQNYLKKIPKTSSGSIFLAMDNIFGNITGQLKGDV